MIGRNRAFDDPIPLPRGRPLVTLKNAADYVMKLPKAEQKIKAWQTETEALIMAAEGRGPLMHARVGTLRALNRHVERVLQSRSQRHALGKAEAEAGRIAILFAVPELTCNAGIQLNERVSLRDHAKAIAS
jgi:hypothetical protein